MTKNLIVTGLFIVITTNLATTVRAAETEAPTRVYEIEVMVFQNKRSDLEGEELWMNERVNPDIQDLDKAVTIGTAPGDESDMTKAREALEQSNDYRILVQKQWVQNADGRSEAKLVRLATEDGDLDGTFKFFMSRFIHVDLNLLFRKSASLSMFQANSPAEIDQINYEIRERRRVRSNELQYFDHPKFGALVQVRQVKTGHQ